MGGGISCTDGDKCELGTDKRAPVPRAQFATSSLMVFTISFRNQGVAIRIDTKVYYGYSPTREVNTRWDSTELDIYTWPISECVIRANEDMVIGEVLANMRQRRKRRKLVVLSATRMHGRRRVSYQCEGGLVSRSSVASRALCTREVQNGKNVDEDVAVMVFCKVEYCRRIQRRSVSRNELGMYRRSTRPHVHNIHKFAMTNILRAGRRSDGL